MRDQGLWDPFHRALPLHDWKKVEEPELDLFRSRIESLTESFKGRVAERKRIREFCLEGDGVLVIWGVPGIGKSALMAQVFTEIKAGITPGGDGADATYPAMMEYFIRRGTGSDSPDQFLRYLNKKLDTVFKLTGISVGNDTNEMWENLTKRLNQIGEKETPEPLVLFVDGLDECPDIRRFVPESRSWLRVIATSRPVQEVKDWARDWDREASDEMEIGPLGESDVRAMLYDVVNRYQEEFDHAYVEAVTRRSQGNPSM